jgi:hypothetical protein
MVLERAASMKPRDYPLFVPMAEMMLSKTDSSSFVSFRVSSISGVSFGARWPGAEKYRRKNALRTGAASASE